MELREYLSGRRGMAAELAEAVGESPAFISQVATSRRPCPAALAVSIEAASAGAVRRWDLRPDDWHRIWPELVGADGAPPVPAESKEVA